MTLYSTSVPTQAVLVTLMTDLTMKLMLHIPALQSNLAELSKNATQAYKIARDVYDEVSAKLTPAEIGMLESFLTTDSNRESLRQVLQQGVAHILADGKVTMSDAVHVLQMIQHIVAGFQSMRTQMSSHVMYTFLYFAMKVVLVLTLTGEEEQTSLTLLDETFQLVTLATTAHKAGALTCCPCLG
jgi:hypothetical protein